MLFFSWVDNILCLCCQLLTGMVKLFVTDMRLDDILICSART